jgi:hypothetical protein
MFTLLWPEIEPLIAAKQPHRRIPKPNAKGWIGPVCSPLREDRNPSFSVKPDSETDPGGYVDHATGETGSIADLARQLGIEVGGKRRKASNPPKPPGMTLEEFARARHLDPKRLCNQWRLGETKFNGRPALRYPTKLGVDRIKYTDCKKPKYGWAERGKGHAHPYGLPGAIKLAQQTRESERGLLFLVNGEPAVWACQQENVPAVCFCDGEGTAPTPEIVDELITAGFTTAAVVYDLDDVGRKGAAAAVKALRAGGMEAKAYQLPAELGEGGDVDDLHRRTGSALREALLALPVLEEVPSDLPPASAGGDHDNKKQDQTQSATLVRLSAQAEYFHTPEGEAYALIPLEGHRETWRVKSPTFRRWLRKLFFDAHDKPPSHQAVQDALGVIEAAAQFDGIECQVFTRVAAFGGAVYLDLANDRWEAVEITAAGWCVRADPPVRFRRTTGMLPIPTPVSGGSLTELRPFLNVGDEASWRLTVGWLVAALSPTSPYPVLILQGEQGSAKSFTARLLRALIDPSTVPLCSPPRDEHDLVISATNAWVMAYDNLSGLPAWLSDGFCRLSTGGGLRTRQLYTDDEEALFGATRPLILNGIEDVATKSDLLDRSIIVKLLRIEKYRVEKELLPEFEAARPRILGALLDAVAAALRNLPTTRIEALPRMADAALWVTAAEPALPWPPGGFLDSYTGNRNEATEIALDADPLAAPVLQLMENRETWEGKATELLSALEDYLGEKPPKGWPANASKLSGGLRRLAPSLRAAGIEVTPGVNRGHQRRLICLKKVPPGAPGGVRPCTADPLGVRPSDASQEAGASGPGTAAYAGYGKNPTSSNPDPSPFLQEEEGEDQQGVEGEGVETPVERVGKLPYPAYTRTPPPAAPAPEPVSVPDDEVEV